MEASGDEAGADTADVKKEEVVSEAATTEKADEVMDETNASDKGPAGAEAAEEPKDKEAEPAAASSGGGKMTNSKHGNRDARRHAPYKRKADATPASHHYSEDKSRRVYVGNLSWEVTWRDLKNHMTTTGCEVTRADVLQTHDGRSKGCGIVEFANSDGAKKAVLTLNDTELLGRQIFVREDREETATVTHPTDGSTQSRRVYVGKFRFALTRFSLIRTL